jgi:hypothetical protein
MPLPGNLLQIPRPTSGKIKKYIIPPPPSPPPLPQYCQPHRISAEDVYISRCLGSLVPAIEPENTVDANGADRFHVSGLQVQHACLITYYIYVIYTYTDLSGTDLSLPTLCVFSALYTYLEPNHLSGLSSGHYLPPH